MPKLPAEIQACLFDLDGVITQTAKVHAAAWKEMFDAFLEERAKEAGTESVPFDSHADYDRYVDGRQRADGVRTFLKSRDIDAPDDLVKELGDKKNELVLEIIRTKGVEVYDGTIRFLEQVRAAGLRTAVVSSSANTRDVLRTVGIEDLFEVRVDGVVAVERGLPGKPEPDTFLAAAEELGIEPAHAAVFEDALAGVEAGRAGNFGLVIGVNRTGQAEALAEHGADQVVDDLDELLD